MRDLGIFTSLSNFYLLIIATFLISFIIYYSLTTYFEKKKKIREAKNK